MSSQENIDNRNVLLFDGFCILCSRFTQKLIKRLGDKILAIPMQSERGEKLLHRHHQEKMPNEVILIYNHEVIKGADAIFKLLIISKGNWKVLAKVLQLLPKRLIDWFYKKVAKNRFIWFGKRDSCYLGNSQ